MENNNINDEQSSADPSQPVSTPQQDMAPPAVTAPPEQVSKKSHRRLILLLLLLAVLAAGLVIGLAWHNKQNKKAVVEKPLTKVNMHMGWLHQAQFAGFYVAKEKGFYKAAGLDVNLKEFKDGEDINKLISDGTDDFGTSTPLEVLSARDSGDKVKAVAAIYQTSPYCFISLKSANISTPADLKGKVLGYVGDNTEAKVTYPALLSAYGISTSEVTTKNIGFDIVQNFQTHAADTADVYRTDQTYLLDKANIPYNILKPEQFGFNIYGDVIVTSDKIVKNNPALAAKFTQATLKGMQYAIDHQDEALTMTAKYENQLYKDPAYEKYILQNSVGLMKPTGGQKLGNMQFVVWNRAYEAIRSANLLKTNIEVSDAYTSEFVK